MKNINRNYFLFLVVLLAYSAMSFQGTGAKSKIIRFKGYITQVNSPTSFLVDDYRVTVENVKDIELENVESRAIKFNPVDQLKVGTFIKLEGKYDTETLNVTVSEIKIDMKQFRHFAETVVLDSKPASISRNDDGSWTGVVVADARRILITSSTKVSFKLNKSEEKKAKKDAAEAKKQKEDEVAKDKEVREPTHAKPMDDPKAIDETDASEIKTPDEGFDSEVDLDELIKGSRPLQSLADIGPGIYLTYRGKEDLSGSVVAEQVVFVKNEKTRDEQKIWKNLRLKQQANKKLNAFSKLNVGQNKYKVIPEMEVQEYVSRLGESLIPEYQRNLPDDDENKIPFVFRVVYERGINAGGYPTGVVVINHDLFNYLESEAQLAFVLSHEIAHTTQEHALRKQNDKKGVRTALKIGGIFASLAGFGEIETILQLTELAMRNGYARTMENQADRIGLSSMIACGYDPREAPRVWKLSSLNQSEMPKNLFWSGHASNAERRSFLWLTIHNTYADLDFSNSKKDSEEFHQIGAIVAARYPLKKSRVVAD